MTRRTLVFMLSGAALLTVSGCMSTEADMMGAGAVADAEYDPEVESTPIALRAGASVGADEIDGFCENGAGVYLSATADSAELTLYVVTPAETVTFERPALHLTTQRDDGETTEVSEFETVTLRAGESWSFSEEIDEGTLVDVVAEVAAQ